MKFKLPLLKFEMNALEPYIDAQTMEIHYHKHHGAYVNNLNQALASQTAYESWDLKSLLKAINELPDGLKQAVQNNGGGHYNHSLFWETLTPKGRPISEMFETLLTQKFGSFEAFKEQFKAAAIKRFGSGWAWLVWNGSELEIISTPNQDAPIMEGYTELLGLDVWEHAYYLKYQNRRADYIDAFFALIDWGVVEKRYHSIKA